MHVVSEKLILRNNVDICNQYPMLSTTYKPQNVLPPKELESAFYFLNLYQKMDANMYITL